MITEKDKSTSIRGIINSLTILFIGIPSLYILSRIMLYFLDGHKDINTSLALSGDFIGGVFGTIISLLTLGYLIATFDLQKRELNETKKYLHKQQFESTFFKMLDMINIIGNDLKIEDSNSNRPFLQGNMFYKRAISMMTGCYNFKDDDKHHYNNFITSHINNTHPNKPFYTEKPMWGNDEKTQAQSDFDIKLTRAWIKENDEEYCGIIYTYCYERFDTQFGHFFRYIYNAMKTVVKECSTNEPQQREYINLIQAQLSNYQLIVMFYSGISKTSFSKNGEAKFHKLADQFEIFQNINENQLLHPDHYKFYPNTHFKFRNGISYNEEIMNKSS